MRKSILFSLNYLLSWSTLISPSWADDSLIEKIKNTEIPFTERIKAANQLLTQNQPHSYEQDQFGLITCAMRALIIDGVQDPNNDEAIEKLIDPIWKFFHEKPFFAVKAIFPAIRHTITKVEETKSNEPFTIQVIGPSLTHSSLAAAMKIKSVDLSILKNPKILKEMLLIVFDPPNISNAQKQSSSRVTDYLFQILKDLLEKKDPQSTLPVIAALFSGIMKLFNEHDLLDFSLFEKRIRSLNITYQQFGINKSLFYYISHKSITSHLMWCYSCYKECGEDLSCKLLGIDSIDDINLHIEFHLVITDNLVSTHPFTSQLLNFFQLLVIFILKYTDIKNKVDFETIKRLLLETDSFPLLTTDFNDQSFSTLIKQVNLLNKVKHYIYDRNNKLSIERLFEIRLILQTNQRTNTRVDSYIMEILALLKNIDIFPEIKNYIYDKNDKLLPEKLNRINLILKNNLKETQNPEFLNYIADIFMKILQEIKSLKTTKEVYSLFKQEFLVSYNPGKNEALEMKISYLEELFNVLLENKKSCEDFLIYPEDH